MFGITVALFLSIRFDIMLRCWEKNPNERPTFNDLRKTMKDLGRNHKVIV